MSEQLESVEKITQAAEQFAKGVAQTAEYQQYETAVNAYRQDDEARELLRRFQSAQEQAQKYGPWGGAVTGNDEDLETLQAEVTSHPILARYFSSQEALVRVLQETNQYMTARLGFDFVELTKPTGGCC